MSKPIKLKKTSFLRKVKRTFFVSILLTFCAVLWLAYTNTAQVTHTTAGRAAMWSGGLLLAPAIDAVPWWGWSLVAGIAVSLWWKHKLTMSILLGILAGIVLAVI